jgi:hypothetical protein
MSFMCGVCNKAQPNKSKPHRVVTETRRKTYPAREYRDGKSTDEMGRRGKIRDPGGVGTEIAKEVDACDGCFTKN